MRGCASVGWIAHRPWRMPTQPKTRGCRGVLRDRKGYRHRSHRMVLWDREGLPCDCRCLTLLISARSAAHCRTAAAIVRSDQSAAIIESRFTKHGRIEHRLEGHGHQTRRASAKLFPASAAMSATPQAKFIAELLSAFSEFQIDGDRFLRLKVMGIGRRNALKDGAEHILFHQVFSP